MNNLFNSCELFIESKFRKYEITKIIRSDQTKRKKIEESRDIKTQKEIMKKKSRFSILFDEVETKICISIEMKQALFNFLI